MAELAEFVQKMGPNGLGEYLRAITFMGKGFGCLENDEVRKNTKSWSEQKKRLFALEHNFVYKEDLPIVADSLRGYTFTVEEFTVEVFWYWDGDGTLVFRVLRNMETLKFLENNDCKYDNKWEEHICDSCENDTNPDPDWMK